MNTYSNRKSNAAHAAIAFILAMVIALIAKQYGTYYITVTDENGNVVLSNAKWSGKSYNIKLSKNTSYDITVTPETNYGYGVYADDGWQTDSTWKVSRTKNCTFCTYY